MKSLRVLLVLTLCFGCDGADSDGNDASNATADGTTGTMLDGSTNHRDQGVLADGHVRADGGGVATDATAGLVDQTVPEPDASLLDRCTPLGRCSRSGGWCESATNPECWRGDAPTCFGHLHPLSRANCDQAEAGWEPEACLCPDGFAAASGEDNCTRVVSGRAQQHGTQYMACTGPKTANYGSAGAVYENTDDDETNDRVLGGIWGPQSPQDRMSGRLNQAGVWACDWQIRDQSGFEPVNQWIGFSYCLSIDTSGDYLFGLSADEQVRLRVNGQQIFESPVDEDASRHWYLRKLSLKSGINIIEIYGLNRGNVGALGAEVSGPFPVGSMETEAAQKAADYTGNIVFSTANMVGTEFTLGTTSGWSCPEAFQVLNTCHAENRCSTIERADCAAPPLVCPAGQHVVDEACVENECICAFGLPSRGVDCASHGGMGCRACFEGYHLEDGACIENECNCENGFAASSAACVEDGLQLCLFCDEGFRLEDGRCLAFQCQCEDGLGAMGAACRVDGDSFCIECDAGFHIENNRCVANTCRCRNGVFDADGPCPIQDGDTCSACDAGFHLDENTCIPNLCICDHGNGAFGPNCLVNGEVRCTQCMDGYQLQDHQCIANQCVCINGTGAAGGECPAPGRLRCAECNPGFRLDGNVCVQAACRCPNGQPVIGAACPGVGVELCESCNDGYQLADGSCQANVCLCPNGQGAIGEVCPQNGGNVCINCDPGYALRDGRCEVRTCQCENGLPAFGEDCLDESLNRCRSCDDEYRLVGVICEPNPDPACDDEIHNGGESDIDCGGPCDDCEEGKLCTEDADCLSGLCGLAELGDGVNPECLPDAVCGNGLTERGEGCDDANVTTESCQYGAQECMVCDAQCQLIPGETSLCGDGVLHLDNGEACDDNNLVNEVCLYGEEACQVCDATCQQVAGSTSFCGDTVTDADDGETCDDGNDSNIDGCTNACRLAACDDGFTNGDETDLDCGGSCNPCADGSACGVGDDCLSQRCAEAIQGDGALGGGPVACPNLQVIGGSNHLATPTQGPVFASERQTLAIQYQVPADSELIVDRVEFFVGFAGQETQGGIWSHDAERNLPGTALAQAPFIIERDGEGWMGVRFERPLTLGAGESYWLTLELVGGRSSNSIDGVNVLYTAKALGSEVWGQVFSGPMMARVVLCDGDGGANGGAGCVDGEPCEQVCLAATVCGDGRPELPEACDDGNVITEICEYGAQACTVCDATCQEVAGATRFCGDDVVNGPEGCDDGNTETETCDYGQRNCMVCDAVCAAVQGATSVCGDGHVDLANGEACDDGNDDETDGCNSQCEVVNECQSCECDIEQCVPGERMIQVDTLNFNGMTFYPLDIDECVTDVNFECCPGSTTQSSMDALCRLAGHCQAVEWVVETLRSDNCYGWGVCTRCNWFPNFCNGGATNRNYITSVSCR
jgi:cysteine-rich repeat protein